MQEAPLIVRRADAPSVRMSGNRGESVRLVDERFDYEHLNARLQRLETDDIGRTHRHPGSDLLCFVVSGELELTTPAGVEVLASGDVAVIPAGMDHSIRKAAGETLTFLEVYAPGRPEFEYA
jgi:quercetin dioxygenase-like cupin family protein